MLFDQFRIILTPRTRGELLDPAADSPLRQTRSEFLLEVLTQRISFGRGTRDFVYVPSLNIVDGTIQAIIGKESQVDLHLGPEEQFSEITVKDWPNSRVFFNLDTGEVGQIMLVEVNHRVGGTFSTAAALVRHINEKLTSADWILDIFPMQSEGSFWQAVEENKGELTQIRFDFRPPNVFGVKDQIDEGLKELGLIDGASSVTAIIQGQRGMLDPSSSRIKESVAYTSKGGGRSRLKAGRRNVYDSQGKPLQVTFVENADDRQLDLFKTIRSDIFKK